VTEAVGAALRSDVAAARSPSLAAQALDHKLGGPPDQRRYTAPSYEIVDRETGAHATIPGFNPIETYEAALANLDPKLVRRPTPTSLDELLTWAGEPLATAEVAMIAQLDPDRARLELGRIAQPIPAGADFYWELPAAA
jgi:hypothetical protein